MSTAETPVDRAPRPPTEHLQGIVERVTFHADDSGYTIARLKVPAHTDLVTLVGRFPSISAGQTLRVSGFWRKVFNGDLGTISSIELEEQEVVVQFAGRQVNYDYADLSELALAWAVTVHKSQGSEYPVVILPLYMQHYLLLSRNLVYTGLTRAKQLAILVGPTKAIGIAIKRIMDRQRYTALAERLKRLDSRMYTKNEGKR